MFPQPHRLHHPSQAVFLAPYLPISIYISSRSQPVPHFSPSLPLSLVSTEKMNYFEASSRKRSRDEDVLMASDIMKKNQRKHGGVQLIGQTTNSGSCDLMAMIDAIERPKAAAAAAGEDGDASRGTTKRTGDNFSAVDKQSEFSDRYAIDEFSADALCGGLVDSLLEEELCFGWFPFSDADLVGFYGGQEYWCGYEDGDGGDFGQLSLWDDDIWQLREINETPPGRKET